MIKLFVVAVVFFAGGWLGRPKLDKNVLVVATSEDLGDADFAALRGFFSAEVGTGPAIRSPRPFSR